MTRPRLTNRLRPLTAMRAVQVMLPAQVAAEGIALATSRGQRFSHIAADLLTEWVKNQGNDKR